MASMQSVTTRGFSLSSGFAGTASLIVTLGFGTGEEVEAAYAAPRFTITRQFVGTANIQRQNVNTANIERLNVGIQER